MKTQLSKPARGHAGYTEEYKKEALELWHASGRSAAKIAAKLGIRAPLLYRWAWPKGQANRSGNESKSGRSVEELEAEVRRLRTENAKLFDQHEVLKIAGHPLRSAAEKYARIEQMSGQYKTAWLCEALLVSRRGYYAWIKRRRFPGPQSAIGSGVTLSRSA